jgi:sugar phosphate isomerase/epimerase
VLRAGDEPRSALTAIGSRLWLARIKDLKNGAPVRLGTGDLPCREFIEALAHAGFDGPVVYEWDRAWIPGLAPADGALAGVAAQIIEWAAPAARGPGKPLHSAP